MTVTFINVSVNEKAMHTASALKKLLSSIEQEEFTYNPKEKERIDWTSYDYAQIHEMSDMLKNIKDAVDYVCIELDIEKKPKSRGRPPVYPGDLAKAVLMQQYFGASNRVAQGLLYLFREKLGVKEFSYKTIERAYDNSKVQEILRRVHELVQEPVSDEEHDFSIDGTGLPTSIKENYEKEKKKKSVHVFEQAIITVGIRYKMMTSFIMTENPHAAEGPYLGLSLENTLHMYSSINTMTGDCGFLSRKNASLIAAAGGLPRLYPKKNVTPRAKGHPAWKKMLYQFLEDPQTWLSQYHQRSISESVNSAFLRMFSKKLTRKIKSRRKTEGLARACNYNLKRFCYLRYLEPGLFLSRNPLN